MKIGWAFATVEKQAGRLERKDTVGKEQRHQGEPDFSKGTFRDPQGIKQQKARSSLAVNFHVPRPYKIGHYI